MKVAIEVKDRGQGEALKAAMNDPVAKATALVIGHLLQIPNQRKRLLTLKYVSDLLEAGPDDEPTA